MTTTAADLTGLFKEVYAPNLINLVPKQSKILRSVKFVPSDKETGNFYHQPVIVTQEHGITYASASDGAFDLDDPISMTTQDAQVQGSQMLLRSSMSYLAAAKASNTKKAFVKATSLIVENMVESMAKRLEIAFLYGQQGLAASVAGSVTATSATVTTIVFDDDEWAGGIWAGLENAKVNFYAADLTTLVSSGSDAIFTVTTVNIETRTVAFTGTSTGSSALVTAAASSVVPFFKGANGKEMAGLKKIFTNTGSLFNIDAAVYGLWKSTTNTSMSGSLTAGKVKQLVAQACNRGLDEDVVAYVSPGVWDNLESDQAALRAYDSSYSTKKAVSGSEGIEYHSQNGKITVMAHSYVKNGDLFIFPPKRLRRIGAQDVSFKTPGMGDDIFLQLPSKAGFEMRSYTDQAIFCEKPAICAYGSGFSRAA